MNQDLYLAAIETKLKAEEVAILGAAVAQSTAHEAQVAHAESRAYVPTPEINFIYSKVIKSERDIERRKVQLASRGLDIDNMTGAHLAELLETAIRQKQQLSSDHLALKSKIAMNESTAEYLAIEIADCINEATEPAMRFKI